jgi:hypothetical protein
MVDRCCTSLLYGHDKYHVHRWNTAFELVDQTWQNKNRVFAVEGPDVTVTAVRRRVPAAC